jgi:hypothetical protein
MVNEENPKPRPKAKEEPENLGPSKDTLDLAKALQQILDQNLDINRQNTEAIKDSVSIARDLSAEYAVTHEQQLKINQANRMSSTLNADINAKIFEREGGLRKSSDIQKDISKSEDIRKKLSVERGEIQKKQMAAVKAGKFDEAAILKDINLGLIAQMDIQGDIKKSLDEELERREKIEKKLGLTGKLMKGVSKIPLVGNLIDGEKAMDAMEEAATKGAGSVKTMMAGLGSALMDIKDAALDPLTIAIAAIKAGLTFDTQVVELQKSMGMSRKEAEGLRHEMSGAAAASGDMAINSERMLKTFSMLQSQLGVAANFSTKMTEDATVLSEKVGLSDEATAGFAKSSLVVGKSIDTQYKNSLGIVGSIRAATGVAVPFKETLEKAGKVSGQIRAQMGGSLEEITKAVATASALGMELEQVASSGRSMLDFQSSIESELEAELLTGKQLNLEKARLLALTGDYKGLAKEISKEAGSFSEFSKMNVLQQDALAKSFGMTSDEMSNMLMDQEMMGKTKEQLIALGKDDLAKKMEERDVNKQMADAVMKLKTVFVDLVGGPVGDFLNLLVLVLEPISILITSIKEIKDLFAGTSETMSKMSLTILAMGVGIGAYFATVKAIELYQKRGLIISKGRMAIGKVIKTLKNSEIAQQIILNRKANVGLVKSIGSAMMTAIKSLGKIPIIGAILGIAAAGTVAAMGAKYVAKAEKGGMIGGNRHSAGGTLIEAEQGEFIMSRQGVQSVGVDNLYAMNRGGGISGGKAQAGGVVQSTSGQSNSGMNMQSFTDAVISAVNNTKPGVVIASPYGLNNTNYQSRNENFKTKFE